MTLSALLEEGSTDSEAGPGSPYQGLEWVVSVDGRTRDSGQVYPGYGRWAQPVHIPCSAYTVPNSAKQC